MKKRIRISGKIDPELIDKIRENLETYQNENVQLVEISVDKASADSFDLNARLVETINDSSLDMEIHSNSDLSITGIAVLSTTNVSNRKAYPYYSFNFQMPDTYDGISDSDLDKLAKEYVQLLKKLIQVKKFPEGTLIKCLKEGTTISYDQAVDYGILRGYRKSNQTTKKTEKEEVNS